MTSDAIREMLDLEPFQPFRIVLSNGVHYDVRNPHLVAFMKSKVFVADAKSEKFSLVSYLHIAALETISNGHAKRRRAR